MAFIPATDHNSPNQKREAAVAGHLRNISECKDGIGSCDFATLTQSEAVEVRAAKHLRNTSDCRDGMGLCDPSKLTSSEARMSNSQDTSAMLTIAGMDGTIATAEH